ncbi:MAG: RpiB/LacA/LacB family sugar-phosphate isomerase, partial [Oscillospiraceae bacterium]|nr:RpiB/LacA/LacB family sugar-phosphate isomerase [Oscillospiraceae bacterium]
MIAIGSDGAGYEIKKVIIEWLKEKNMPYEEFGCMNGESCDYPLVAKEVCEKIVSGGAENGILVCGTG